MKYYITLCYSLSIYWLYLVYENRLVAEFARSPFLSDMWLNQRDYYIIVISVILFTILVLYSVFKKQYHRILLLSTYFVFGDAARVNETYWLIAILIMITILFDVYKYIIVKNKVKSE